MPSFLRASRMMSMRALDGDREPVGARAHVRLAKLGDDEGVDPFAVRGAVDLGEDLRFYMFGQ